MISGVDNSALDEEWMHGGNPATAAIIDTNENHTRARSSSDGFLLQDLLSDVLEGFQPKEPTPDEETTPEYRIAQVHKFIDSFNSGRVNGILMSAPDLFHPDVVLHDPNLGTHSGDWRTIADYWERVFDAYDNQHLKVLEIGMQDENIVSAKWTLSARHIKTSFGIPASWKTATIAGSSTYEFRGGKMSQVSWTWSGISLAQQLLALAGGSIKGAVSREGVRNIVSSACGSESGASQDTVAMSPGMSASSPEMGPEPEAQSQALDLKTETVGSETMVQNGTVGLDSSWGPLQAVPIDASSCIKMEQNAETVDIPEPIQTEAQVVGQDHSLLRTIASARASEPWYMCGYCGVRKPSTSAGGDGRVRIRCECGGKHRDRKSRMHANWRPCTAGSQRSVYQHI